MKNVLHRTLPLSLAALSLAGGVTYGQQPSALSASGRIDQEAHVKAHVQIEIAAPPERVWALLIDAPSWPRWATQINSVVAPGPLAVGTRFIWKSGGTTVHSEVHFCDKQQTLSWTGTALTATAIHVWHLQPSATGTLVTVEESMTGPLINWLYPSAKLAKSDTDWLKALKQAAEQTP